MSTYYVTVGSVRGECGHRHRTPQAAQRCLQRDMDGCADQGGYSDRQVMVCEHGRLRALTDAEEAAICADDAP